MDEKQQETILKALNNAVKRGKQTFLCPSCAHRDVCKNIDEEGEKCGDFLDGTSYQRYSSIHHFFQPIFDWIKFHYPAGEILFIVDHNSAKMMIEHRTSVYSKEITNFGIISKNEEGMVKTYGKGNDDDSQGSLRTENN